MFLHHIIILALIQGITEFLPISSSGHLVLGHAVLHGDINDISWKSSDVVLDVAVHIGTLLSVMIYFREDLKSILSGGLSAINGKGSSQESFLALYILVASLPVVIAGLVLNALSPDWVRSIHVVDRRSLFPERKKPSRHDLEIIVNRWVSPGSGACTRHKPIRNNHDRGPILRIQQA